MGGIKGEKGFTLVEIVITMGVMGIVLLVMCSILTTCMSIQKSSNEITAVHNQAAMDINNETYPVTPSTITMEFKGVTPSIVLTSNGYYLVGQGSKNTYKYFKPNGWSH